MAARVQVVEVGSAAEIDSAISSWITQGYVLANRTPSSATMFKKKEFSALWAVIGFLICIIPLLVYIIVYAADSDKMVEIRVSSRGDVDDPLDEIDRLKELHDRGAITNEEFEQSKRRLLGGRRPLDT